MIITRNDVARLAGVSSATVSYVVNNGPRPVSEKTKNKVLDAIELLGYEPNGIARSLKTKRTTTIGVLITDMMNPVISAITKSIEDALLPLGYNMIICNSDENPERELVLLRMLMGKRVDGIIILPTGQNINFLQSLMTKRKLPIVLIDREVELHTSSVCFENASGAYLATKHLIELDHKRIAFLNLPLRLTPGKERANGYERALREAGITIDTSIIANEGFKAEQGSRPVEKILQAAPHPTAIFVSSNRLLNEVLQYTKIHSIRIPKELAIAVFDDVPFYSIISPSITAVRADLALMGQEACWLLKKQIDGNGSEPQKIRIPCELQIRESSGAQLVE